MGDITRLPIQSHPGYVAGRWYSPVSMAFTGGAAPGANSVRLLPFWLARPVTISDLACRVTTNDGAGHMSLALYASDAATKLPTGVALLSTGSLSAAAAGNISGAVSEGNKLLQPGLYWMAVNTDSATAVFVSPTSATSETGYLVGTTTLANIAASATTLVIVKTIAQTYGTWPDLTGASLVEVSTVTAAAVFFKAA